jgi:hypothetical protein
MVREAALLNFPSLLLVFHASFFHTIHQVHANHVAGGLAMLAFQIRRRIRRWGIIIDFNNRLLSRSWPGPSTTRKVCGL